MLTIYVYDNATGEQVDAIVAADNVACEDAADAKWGSNDYHWSYVDMPISNAV